MILTGTGFVGQVVYTPCSYTCWQLFCWIYKIYKRQYRISISQDMNMFRALTMHLAIIMCLLCSFLSHSIWWGGQRVDTKLKFSMYCKHTVVIVMKMMLWRRKTSIIETKLQCHDNSAALSPCCRFCILLRWLPGIWYGPKTCKLYISIEAKMSVMPHKMVLHGE